MTTDPREQRFRDLMSAFPTGVAVVTGMHPDGTPRGMTCSSVTSVTLRPPTLLVCLRVGSSTLEAVSAQGGFAVNLLHDGARHAAEVFSSAVADRFRQVSWRTSASGMPRLDEDAFAVAECQVSGLLTVGDKAVVFGEVRHVEQVDGAPLLYVHRRFTPGPLTRLS
ncbi:flavin reductase family protein [Kutzneria sp. CA-103260]|uniref:flavin reductase family protein n=1 Tax=Kutzneria sp. CA-103260 TaxID=2802641 RepID=UPI001BA7A4F4|nr:flavin reductase family protein [Kutzneria sp. CA-103260]QUQ64342.1 flavin reductase [Kutzneria sp. CA-103260]